MTLPHSYGLALMLTILTMFCWGSWANALKFAKGWRFELLYYDYSIGVALGALVAGLTFGTLGPGSPQFLADLTQAGGINIFYGFLGGVIFNLSNILVVGAISVAGMGVGFPIGVGLALVVGVIWNYILKPQGNPWLLALGVGPGSGCRGGGRHRLPDARRQHRRARRRRRQTKGHMERNQAGGGGRHSDGHVLSAGGERR